MSVGANGEANAEEWLAWAIAYADAIDPLRRAFEMPSNPEPSPEQLKPYLQGLNPYGPDSWR